MKNVTYQNYLSDPAVRAELEDEARRARNEAIDQYLITPVTTMVKRMFNTLHSGPKAASALLTPTSAA
jgi:hypothetical protein